MGTKKLLLFYSVALTLMLARGQSEVPPPNFHNPYEKETNKTMDELISETVGGVDVAANMMLAPGSQVLAELDMYLTNEQFLGLYEPPKPEDMMKMGLMPAPVGTVYDEQRKNFFDADQVNSRHKRKATRDPTHRWPKGEMPYLLAKGHFDNKEEYMIRRAMTEWEKYTCVRFRPAGDTDWNFVRFQNGVGCNSQLGMVGGVQVLNLQAPGCRYKGLYLHEIGHALGLVHEHQLPNRDNYINILYYNVSPHMRVWFNKYTSTQVNQMDVPYELSSVMHYGITAFSKDGKAQTIRANDRSKEHTIGKVYMKELAYTDVMIVNRMYNCSSHCPNQNKCSPEGHVDQNCNCICRDGSQDCDTTKRNRDGNNCVNRFDSWSCYIWANQGECERNPTYMNKNCAKACRSCGSQKDDSGSCKDVYQETRCRVWKTRGDCVTNSKWMEENCRATCNFCNGVDAVRPETNCDNKHNHAECVRFALVGECQVNKKYMSGQCAKSCHKCDDQGTDDGDDGTDDGGEPDEDKLECSDKNDMCDTWSKNGECSANPGWMINNCRKSCDKCDDKTCKNLYDDIQCQIWEQKLQCLSNSEWMHKHCAKSCLTGLCKDATGPTNKPPTGTTPTDKPNTPSSCRNAHSSDTECDVWAKNDHCNINPTWMNKYCARSCGSCVDVINGRTTTSTSTTTSGRTNVCADAEKGCAGWAKHGFCDKNPRYNLVYCKKSCNNCNGCRDTEFLCSIWAKADHCVDNARYMLRHCQKSCNACLMDEKLEGFQPVQPHEETTSGSKTGAPTSDGMDDNSGAHISMTSYSAVFYVIAAISFCQHILVFRNIL